MTDKMAMSSRVFIKSWVYQEVLDIHGRQKEKGWEKEVGENNYIKRPLTLSDKIFCSCRLDIRITTVKQHLGRGLSGLRDKKDGNFLHDEADTNQLTQSARGVKKFSVLKARKTE